MTNNEILLRRIVADILRTNEKVTKALIRKRIKGLKFVKDGNGFDTSDERVDAAHKFALQFALIRLKRNFTTPSFPTPLERFTRLKTLKRQHFLECVQCAAFRQTKSGKHITCVQFVADESLVKALSWEGPGGRLQKDKKIDSEHRFFIMNNWKTQVEDRGLALLNGKLTLCAGDNSETLGVKMFPAIWVSQDEGCTLKTNRGHITFDGNNSIHINAPQNDVAV
jgi:hypothetical protein